MKRKEYEVYVTKTHKQAGVVKVEAKNKAEAKKLALKMKNKIAYWCGEEEITHEVTEVAET